MEPGVRNEIERVLENHMKEIISKYASYVDFLREAIIKKKVKVDDLRSYLLSLPATCEISGSRKLFLLSDKEPELQECKTVTAIFNLLQTKCASSFLNYDIFQCILKRYKIVDTQEELQYPEHLKDYISKHEISEFIKINPLLKSKNGSKKLILKYDIKTTCSLTKLTDLKKLIANIMDMSSLALEIIDIKEGCVIVTFLIPPSIADAFFTPNTVFTPQQEKEMRAASVLWLKCNGRTFHFDKQSQGKISYTFICS